MTRCPRTWRRLYWPIRRGPTAAGHLHRVDEGLQATHRDLLAIMSAWLTSYSDPAIPSAAHQMIGTIHAATAATGPQLIAQARLS